MLDWNAVGDAVEYEVRHHRIGAVVLLDFGARVLARQNFVAHQVLVGARDGWFTTEHFDRSDQRGLLV